MITYKNDSSLGHGSFIAVLRGDRRIGRIHHNQATGMYQFYRETGGTAGPLNPNFSDPDLDALKRKIETRR